jgi:hypothetical protein
MLKERDRRRIFGILHHSPVISVLSALCLCFIFPVDSVISPSSGLVVDIVLINTFTSPCCEVNFTGPIFATRCRRSDKGEEGCQEDKERIEREEQYTSCSKI